MARTSKVWVPLARSLTVTSGSRRKGDQSPPSRRQEKERSKASVSRSAPLNSNRYWVSRPDLGAGS